MNKNLSSLRDNFSTINPILVVAMILFFIAFLRVAWVGDDTYITLRTVDNFVYGRGLTWNPGERVQVYTHPLWMLLLSGIYFFIRNAYFATIILSLMISTAGLLVFAKHYHENTLDLLVVLLPLFLSKSFMDFSVSGLENPLTHLLIVLFYLRFFSCDLDSMKQRSLLGFLASLAAFNRMDTILIFVPPLLYILINYHQPKYMGQLILSFFPFILWELFATFYYGFPFPNTAYAKLNTGIPNFLLVKQGVIYVLDSVNRDPITLTVIGIGGILSLFHGHLREKLALGGIVLYICYTVYVGGDFMSGRFFSGCIVLAILLLANRAKSWHGTQKYALLGAFIILGYSITHPPITGKFESMYPIPENSNGVLDERAAYYPVSGLMNFNRKNPIPAIAQFAREGLQLRENHPGVHVSYNIGFLGFYAGPDIYIVDMLALSDPFLARLPVRDPIGWRIGHFARNAPPGYVETLQTGQNVIEDSDLATYYEKLKFVVQGPLWSLERLATIWKFNTGQYDYLLKHYIPVSQNQP